MDTVARDLNSNGCMNDQERTSSFSFVGGSGPEVVAIWAGGGTSASLPRGATVTIGRGAEADLRVDHPSVSRAHVRVHALPNGRFEVEDLGSANGTRLNGQMLLKNARIALDPGAILEAGAAMIIVKIPPGHLDAEAACVEPFRSATEVLDKLVTLVAQGSLPVLLTGETGVGKELWAHRVHHRSPRAGRPWVPINCAAIPESLVESELFGHERGAFTGATSVRVGLIEAAGDGTVFLDEVTELPVRVQAKLLRVLESREVYRLGSSTARAINARFLSATNRGVRGLIASGEFRADLYYRLNGLTLEIPPLRQRRTEIPPLAQEFTELAAKSLGIPAPLITRPALQWLQAQDWPGNIRELKNRVDCACLLCQGRPIEIAHLNPQATDSPEAGAVANGADGAFWTDQKRMERESIFRALEACDGNQTHAAKKLGISRRTLINRLDDYDITRPRRK